MASEAADFGLILVDDEDEEEVAQPEWHLWPENWRTWCLWLDLRTQWRVGMAGATGLDYAAVLAVIDRRYPRRKREEAFDAIRGMECAVLKIWADQAEKKRQDMKR